MKKSFKAILIILALAIATFASIGCRKPETPIYTDPAKVISAKVNGEFIIALDSNPTTGYSWEERHDDTFLNLVNVDYKGSEAQGKLGTGGVQYFWFKAIKAGETQIVFNYMRPWESFPPKDTKTFTVKIQ